MQIVDLRFECDEYYGHSLEHEASKPLIDISWASLDGPTQLPSNRN